MTLDEEKQLLKDVTELRTDMKWVRDWCTEHKSQHASYFYLFIATIVGVFVSLVESFRR